MPSFVLLNQNTTFGKNFIEKKISSEKKKLLGKNLLSGNKIVRGEILSEKNSLKKIVRQKKTNFVMDFVADFVLNKSMLIF